MNDGLVDSFRARGFVTVREVFTSDEMARYAPALRDYIRDVQTRGGMDSAPFSKAIRSDTPTEYSLADAPADVAEFVTSPRLGEIAARALGADAVRVLHFTGHFKPSGGGPTPWHQDLAYIPLDTDDVVSIWTPLADVTEDMGPLVFAEGSHQQGFINELKERRFRVVRNASMRLGDVSLHAGWTMHGAMPNNSPRVREAVTVCYYRDGARLELRNDVAAMRTFLNSCFAGLALGELAATPQNPVVYRRNG